MKNEKVFQIIDSLEIGGSERMSVNMYNTFTSNNIENFLIVSRKTGPLYNFIQENKNVVFLNKKGSLDILSFFRFFKLIKKYKPTLIHAHQTSIYWTFLVKILYPKTTVIWHDHWGFSDLLKDSDRRIIKYFSFLINGVVCVNNKIKIWNINNLKVTKETIVYIPNYPLIQQIQKRKKTKTHTLLCVANIRSQKDHPNLLEACVLLKEQKIDFELLLAGSLENINWVKKIKNLILDLNLENYVKILGPITDVSEILGKADVGVLSSLSEGLPLSLLEYGLAELPVICTDVGQCKEVLGDGEFGWIVPPKSPLKLAIAIKEALEKKELANLKAIGLKRNIYENYGAKGFVVKYFNLINTIKN
ncbi:glycosyltransferase [Thalassobellus citreus]|uniref:glycosyltransferase n=1 Tax=Thalassobellus citreus TaxID=3367752 RepID=UPI00379E80B5